MPRCEACHHTNPAESSFCEACGTRLGPSCPSCSGPVSEGARFCGQCGALLEAVSPASADSYEERRQLTVLFADLAGSTPLAATLGDERFSEVVQIYQGLCEQAVERFDGHPAKYMGDGIMVYFGYPSAHEDDAERAVRAALLLLRLLEDRNEEIHAQYGVRLTTRIGIHTGPVILSGVEPGGQVQALGDAVNRAARIEGAAEPNTAAISAETLRLVRGLFVTEEMGATTLKGIAEPVPLFRVVQPSGVTSRLELAAGHLTPFVGRKQELDLLVECWERVVEGEGQTVFVSGEAGFGKSRLVISLREQLAEQPHTWLECRCSPYTQGTALQPVIELAGQALRLGSAESGEERLVRLEEAIGRVGLEPTSVVPLLADLLGVPLGDRYAPGALSPELQRERTFEALVAFVLALGELQPLLLLVEDLHWSDPSSVELLGRMIEELASSPVLLVLTARPEFEVPWANPKSWTSIHLSRLRGRDARELLTNLPGAERLPEVAREELVQRADGVPLYLEELARAAVESEQAGAAIAVPATLQDSLMARLDRLSTAKEVAQQAAVLGREFDYGLLAPVTEMGETSLRYGLERLVEADVLRQRGAPPRASYTFKHALLQETAYASLLGKRRRELHRRTAAALAEHFPERAEAEPALLAQHLEQAGEIDAAAAAYERAGRRAAKHVANAEAQQHLRRSLDLVAKLPDPDERDRRELALELVLGRVLERSLGIGHEEVGAVWQRALTLARQVDDIDALLASIAGLGAFELAHSRLGVVLDLVEQGRAAAGDATPLADAILGSLATRACFYLAEFGRALEYGERSIRAHDSMPHEELAVQLAPGSGHPRVMVGIYQSWSLMALGQVDQAVEGARRGVEFSDRIDDPYSAGLSRGSEAFVHVMRLDLEATQLRVDEALAIARDEGFPLVQAVAMTGLGWSQAWQGNPEGPATIKAGLAGMGSTGAQVLVPIVLALLAESIVLVDGDRKEASQLVETGLRVADQGELPFWNAELHRVKGGLALSSGEEAEAEALFLRAIDIARAQEARLLELRAAMDLARLWQGQGRMGEARAVLEPIFGTFREGHDAPLLKQAKALLEVRG